MGSPLARASAADFDSLVDDRTRELLERRRHDGRTRRRGWLIRRLLLAADVIGLSAAFVLTYWLTGPGEAPGDRVPPFVEIGLFAAALPFWIVVAKLEGLYDRDEERTNHTTLDELTGVVHVVTLGSWLAFAGAWLTGLADPNAQRVVVFWVLANVLVTSARGAARAIARRSGDYLQNAVIVGAGDVGQLIARKLLQHREYGINVLGLVDRSPKERRPDLRDLAVLGQPEQLNEIVRALNVERVIVAFSNESEEQTIELVRSLNDLDVQVDLVPRLYEIVGPRVTLHTVEGTVLVGLPPLRLARSSRMIKRAIDIVGAAFLLVVTAPFFAYIAWRIKRDSPGPVFFRQTRLGMNMREFTALKFRTMRLDTDETAHRDFIRATMTPKASIGSNGLYKLERDDCVTNVGRWLRRTSLDELPQLINVLRGEMSLVGPRPCIPYEAEQFEPHHFERFLVPAGLTGLWQVTARARSTFGEALEMDVVYVRGWSLSLDLQLLFRTPIELLRSRATA